MNEQHPSASASPVEKADQARNETPTAQTFQCYKCGRDSTIKEAFFIKETGSSRKPTHILCFECKNKEDSSVLGKIFLLVLIFGLLLYALSPFTWLGRFYLLMCAGVILMLPLIVMHELSHAIMARAVGLKVFAIYLGTGKMTRSFRLFGIRWFMSSLPFSGLTVAAGPDLPYYRWHMFLIYLAGPGLHVLLTAFLAWMLSLQLHPFAYLAMQTGLWTNVFLFLSNIYPRKVATGLGIARTDGWAMLNIRSLKSDELQLQHAMYHALEATYAIDLNDKSTAQQWVEKGLALYPTNPHLINAAGFVYAQIEEYAKARENFLKVLDCKENLSEGIKYIAMNNIAYMNVMLEDASLLAEADEYSAQAYKNLSWEPIMGGTRGAVLIALGQIDEGITLLKKAMGNVINPRSKASNACMIARGEYKRGNLDEAQKYLSAARSLDPACSLIQHISREIKQP